MSTEGAGGPLRRSSPDARPRSRLGTLVRHNLVALGGAAVLTVYAAGYARTRDAAERFAEADRAVRRPVPPVTPPVDSATPHPERADPATIAASPVPSVATTGADREIAKHVPLAPAPSGAPVAAPVSAVADSALPEAQPESVTTQPVTGLADSVAAAPPPDSSVKPMLKDGEYYGWGTSRHGDIQAGVEIKGGRITGAWVQQCLTRYSCSWIAALPGQVVARQSPDVDYVSGATQSTNAFYYAVVEALSRAK